ncbi:sensor histidine kinase [Paenibacillus physcomitrellae]|uniref:histidine kinase n=1 Tax=Paenibacillus physcomitrellae TaxID=1619311 RepID=A0ABQ1FWZ0_9BACL|nr:ATP-binding protein [Paenibacillus physcomitrellae]GGA32136.1 two-component sensor histidine kinase [Paenibacillus physcomitrellae]
MSMRGVVFKLFAVTSALILVLFSLVMLLESLFFERFYRSSKIHDLSQNMQVFARQLQQEDKGGSEQEMDRMLGTFMNRNDASTALLNGEFNRVAINPYFIQLRTADKSVTVLFPSEGMTVRDLQLNIQPGDQLVVDGIYMDEKDTVLHPVEFQPSGAEPGEGLMRVSGTVTDLILPEQRSFNPYYQDALVDNALRDLAPQSQPDNQLSDGNLLRREWTDEWSGVEYAVLIQPLPELQTQSGEQRYLLAMTSLQPVGEAVGTLKQYFVYAAPAILLLVVLLSLIYSRIVSRPLVKLNRLSERLARLDFSAQPDIRSRDEFGTLSRNLVSLSRNLDETLRELSRTNWQLKKDVAEKERSEQLRRELIANLSHELKTPLGIVKGFAEGLQDDVAEEKRERYLALIVHETDRMNALILEMLELSKYELKAVKLHTEVFPLTELIETMAASFSQQMEKKGLTFRMETQGGGAERYVTGDPGKLEQVILNLLSNAVRHASPNSTIYVEVGAGDAGTLTVWIENTGAPIAEEDLDRIWDHFYRVERSRDRKSGGTGLGLAIVKHILELHGSRYGAVNTAKGVAFYFTLQEFKGDDYEDEYEYK